ncbi:Uncharacterised protein [Neisseria zoodegmatis]|uniref:DUF4328 domain-containing protein n=1 Tax=Neisseria zoodegmatis TaxID=326523 RepID=A0AB38DUS7_9NEIS|nr:hypothetical protein BWD10_01345 [Neisseria zoodegmatis]SNU80633.1 Uncharacterised protein [Neisseria zoodegmatis]
MKERFEKPSGEIIVKQESAVYTYQNQDKRTRWLLITFIIYIVLNVLSGFGEMYALNTIKQAAASITEEGIESSAYEAVLSSQNMVFYLYLTAVLVFVVTAVLTAKWIMQANKNARALGATEVEMTPGWSVGWFFVPIMNLFMPLRGVTQIWNGSMRAAGKPAHQTMLYVWWGSWVVGNILGRLTTRVGDRAWEAMEAAQTEEAFKTALSSYLSSGYVGLLYNVLTIISALALLKIIYSVNQAQEQSALPPTVSAAPEAER